MTAGTLRRLGPRPDAVPLEEARAKATHRSRVECAAWEMAARAAYARALHAEQETVVALACEVARAVLGREAESSPAVLRDLTARAMAKVRRAKVILLRVHPDDVETAEREAGQWIPAGMERVELLVAADTEVQRGGVVVETALGRVDASLDRQIEEVARILDGRAKVV